MKKRMISLLLALVMILGMIPAMAPAASAADVKDEINIIRLVGPKNGRYLDFECGVSLLGVKVDGIRWVDHTTGEKYEIEYPGTHEPVEVVAGHEYRVVIFMSTTDGSVFPDPADITASIPGASSVSAGRVGNEGADAVCVTGYFTAAQGNSDIIGVKVSGDGYYWNRDGEAVLNLNMDSQAFLYDDDSIGPVEGTRMGSLYTDQALTKPATSMEVGEAYYFEYTLWHKSGEVNKVDDYDSSLDFEGFSSGTVIKTTTGGNNNFTMLCSIVYGDMNVDRVEAVGTGYGYDSEKGAYAPIFESIKAYNADGFEFDYDGFTWSTPFYTKSAFSSANKLTSEPQNGETYYFGIYIDQYLDGMSYGYTGSLELMDNSVVTLFGFDVECVGFMEREMGSYLELTYAATKRDPDIYVGGVGMNDGDYLAVGATTTQTTKPSGGYAYYKDGTLTLNNYSYEGKGYLYNSSKGWYATVYAEHDLTVELVGTNSLKQTASESEGIRVGVFDSSEKLTIQGDGSLNVTSTYCGILAWGSITVNGGTVTATGIEKAIQFSTGFTVAAGMEIQASTTADGELGEYVAANHNTYKKIVITEKSVNPFTDVKEGDFYYDPVMWAVQNGITNGVDATHFGPGQTCNRAQVVTFLWRASGSPEPTSSKNPFVDVATTSYYYKPVLWAVEKGITNGVDATHFGPGQPCNRAQVVTFLWRAGGSPEPTSSKNPFVDVATTSYYYKPVLWAVKNSITNGLDATHFGPTTDCNRAQVVTFLYRAYN